MHYTCTMILYYVRDFGIQCDEVRARLRSQIIQWSTQQSCHDDRCKYEASIFSCHERNKVTCIIIIERNYKTIYKKIITFYALTVAIKG